MRKHMQTFEFLDKRMNNFQTLLEKQGIKKYSYESICNYNISLITTVQTIYISILYNSI